MSNLFESLHREVGLDQHNPQQPLVGDPSLTVCIVQWREGSGGCPCT